MTRHYDVVIVGMSIGALATAAILARRSFRVLLVGQGARPRSYRFDGIPLMRRTSTFLAGSSPAWQRITTEIASAPFVARKYGTSSWNVQLVLSQARLVLDHELTTFAEDIGRSYAPLRRVAERLIEGAEEKWRRSEATLRDDVVWTGGTFWERRKANRLRAELISRVNAEVGNSGELPKDHEWNRMLSALVSFTSYVDGDGENARHRALSLWSRQAKVQERNEEARVSALVDRVATLGGDVRLSDRVARIERSRRRVSGVMIDGDETQVGCNFVISDLGVRALLDLTPDLDPSAKLLAELPEFWTVGQRFVLSVLVREEGIPKLARAEMIILADSSPTRGAYEGGLHVERVAADHAPSGIPSGTALLVVECILGGRIEQELEDARERILARLEQIFPFIERHYLVVDSPHDGRPVWDYRAGEKAERERAVVRPSGGSFDAEPMTPHWRLPHRADDDAVGEPIRTPLPGALSVGPRALPRFGQEGELMAALSAAHIVTKSDPGRERIRRAIWRRTDL